MIEDEQVTDASSRNAARASQSARSREKQPAIPVKKRTLPRVVWYRGRPH